MNLDGRISPYCGTCGVVGPTRELRAAENLEEDAHLSRRHPKPVGIAAASGKSMGEMLLDDKAAQGNSSSSGRGHWKSFSSRIFAKWSPPQTTLSRRYVPHHHRGVVWCLARKAPTTWIATTRILARFCTILLAPLPPAASATVLNQTQLLPLEVRQMPSHRNIDIFNQLRD